MSDIDNFVLDRLGKIEDKIDAANDRIYTQMDHHGKLLEDYNQSLREHMRRTDILEKRQVELEFKVEPLDKERQAKLIVDEHRLSIWKKIVAVIGVIATIVGAAAAISQLF